MAPGEGGPLETLVAAVPLPAWLALLSFVLLCSPSHAAALILLRRFYSVVPLLRKALLLLADSPARFFTGNASSRLLRPFFVQFRVFFVSAPPEYFPRPLRLCSIFLVA